MAIALYFANTIGSYHRKQYNDHNSRRFSVDGLQDLNMNIDNNSGTFISSATVTDNKLLITTKKVYKNTFDKKETWPNYIAFLEPAYKLSQAKVVLKKK